MESVATSARSRAAGIALTGSTFAHSGTQIQSRQPLFDQLTVNMYAPGEGITAHVDLERFEDGIAIVSLGCAAVMDFTRGECHERLLLQPGDVLLLEGDARWDDSPHGVHLILSVGLSLSQPVILHGSGHRIVHALHVLIPLLKPSRAA